MYLSTIRDFEQKICLAFWKKKNCIFSSKNLKFTSFFSAYVTTLKRLFSIFLYLFFPSIHTILSFLSAIVEVEVNVICSERVESSKLFLKQKVHIQVFNFQLLKLNLKFLKQIKTIFSILNKQKLRQIKHTSSQQIKDLSRSTSQLVRYIQQLEFSTDISFQKS